MDSECELDELWRTNGGGLDVLSGGLDDHS